MTGDDIARLFYLSLLATALVGWFVAQNRMGLGPLLQRIVVWGLLFLGVIGGYGLWQDIRTDVMPRQMVLEDGARIEVPRAADGHFYLDAEVVGRPVTFVVDTGASDIVLTQADAARLGHDPGSLVFSGQALTANGTVPTARITLETLRLGGITDHGVRALVTGGEMTTSLLGMRYLQRWGRLEIAGQRLILER